MKKLLLSLSAVALLALPTVKAQYINPDFEIWTHTAGPPSYDDPNTGMSNPGWQELNFTSQTLAGSSPVSVFKDSSLNPVTPQSGMYCAKIQTVILSSATISLAGKYLPNDTLGVLFTGQINVISQKIVTKIPFNLPVATYKFYYQYFPSGVDTAFCTVTYFRNDTVIAAGKTQMKTLQNTWMQASVMPFVLKSGLPDSIAIWYSSSTWTHGKANAGSTLFVDDATNTGIPSLFGGNNGVTVYPNPAKNEVTIKIAGNTMAEKAEIFDITGKTVGTFSVRNNDLTINTQQYSSGLYFYRLYDNNGTQMNAGKFSVVK